MSVIEEIASRLADSAGSFKERTEEFVKTMDYRIEIEKMEEQIDELYMEIGEIVCRYMDAGEKLNFTGMINDKYKKVNILKNNIINKKKTLNSSLRNSAFCHGCGEMVDKDSNYCPLCGKKL